MKLLLAFVLITLSPAVVIAQDVDIPAGRLTDDIILENPSVSLEEFLWIKRPIVVFADSPADPRFIEQMALINDRLHELESRDVVVLTDTDPSARSALRRQLHPRGFMLALVGKDGVVYLRRPLPWDVREITRSIDKRPIRQQEIRDSKGAS